MNSASTDSLLAEIRDLLTVVAEASLPQYNESVRLRLGKRVDELRQILNSEKGWDALRLMDGTRAQKVIVNAVPIDAGQLSRLVKKLAECGFVVLNDGTPTSTLSRWEIDAVRSTSRG